MDKQIPMTESLDETARRFDTDKVSGLHDFLHLYERRLSHLKQQEFNLFEVGVLRGGSVQTWGDYFPRATVVGIDLTEECRRFESGNVRIRIGDATRADFLFDVIQEFGRPTVFVDDGSHRWDHQIFSLQMVFPLLIPGGYFIMEDLDTSFEGQLQKAPFDGFSKISTMEYLYRLSRVVVAEGALASERPYDMFAAEWAPWIGSIEFGRRTCVISKKLAPGGGPR